MKQRKGRRRNLLVQLHTRPVISPSCESAASQYRVGLLRFESGRVLVFQGGVFGCSSRMNGKPSSPVLRGLGASNGARLLDPSRIREGLPVTRPQQASGVEWARRLVISGSTCVPVLACLESMSVVWFPASSETFQ